MTLLFRCVVNIINDCFGYESIAKVYHCDHNFKQIDQNQFVFECKNCCTEDMTEVSRLGIFYLIVMTFKSLNFVIYEAGVLFSCCATVL